jgi:processive 1,2-diacylglycerol beta-glucosyltransferase
VQQGKKRILIFSASFGGGHRSASESLRKYLIAHHRGEVEVRVVDFYKQFAPGVNLLTTFAYHQSVQFFPQLYGTFFDLSNRIQKNPVFDELVQVGFSQATAFVDSWAPDAVISVYPIAGGIVAEMKETRPFVAATVVTDYGVHRQWLHPETDLFFVASREAAEEIAVLGVPWERIVVSGIPIHERFVNRPSRAESRRELGLENRFTVLLTIAGTPGEVKSLAGELCGLGVQVVAATGHGSRVRRRLQTLAKSQPLLHPLGYVKDMNVVMSAADVLVGKAGGLTVSEALAMGMPLIMYNPIPGQEIYNVDFLVNYGAGMWGRDEADVVEKVRFLSTHPRRLAQMAENAQLLGKPGAAGAVCERVLAAIDAAVGQTAGM